MKAKYMKESKGEQKMDANKAMDKDHPMRKKKLRMMALKKKMSKYRKY